MAERTFVDMQRDMLKNCVTSHGTAIFIIALLITTSSV